MKKVLKISLLAILALVIVFGVYTWNLFGPMVKGAMSVKKLDDGLYYMFHGDVTYCDAALKANKLSIVFEDKEAARQTLDRVREFIQQNPTVYLSTHCPEGYENLELKRVMKL